MRKEIAWWFEAAERDGEMALSLAREACMKELLSTCSNRPKRR